MEVVQGTSNSATTWERLSAERHVSWKVNSPGLAKTWSAGARRSRRTHVGEALLFESRVSRRFSGRGWTKRALAAAVAIGFIALPERAANVCFGGRYRNRLFMAASHSIYSLYVNTQGVAGG
jgi:hypothetical protein